MQIHTPAEDQNIVKILLENLKLQHKPVQRLCAIWHIQHQCVYSKWRNTKSEMNAIAGINWRTCSILLLNIFTHSEWWKIMFVEKSFPFTLKKMWKGNNKIWVCFSERRVGEHYYCDFFFLFVERLVILYGENPDSGIIP